MQVAAPVAALRRRRADPGGGPGGREARSFAERTRPRASRRRSMPEIVDGQLKKWYSGRLPVRAALPGRGPRRRGPDHRKRSRRSARTSASAASPATRSGRSCERRVGDGPGARPDGTLPLRAHPAQALRRGAARRPRRTASTRRSARSSPARSPRSTRCGVQIGIVRRRRQHLPRPRRRGRAAWTARPATTSACSRRS